MIADRSLNDIAVETGTDKSDRWHGYTGPYEEYLAPWRRRSFTLLEIGVAGGASLRMWSEYFPEARIYGLDRNPDCRSVASGGIEVFIGDQADPRFLAQVLGRTGPPDLVIDDGSHIGEQQIRSFECLFPALREGGLYVVEDLHTSYWGWGLHSAMEYFKTLVDDVMVHGRSRCGLITNDPNYPHMQALLGYFERTLESIHFHRSIIFLRKRRTGEPPLEPEEPWAGSTGVISRN